jgi:multidrug resistance efflux pump
MHRRPPIPVVIFLFLLLAILGLWWYGGHQSTSSRTSGDYILASGTIEDEEVAIAAEVGGRVQTILADEGDEVTPGATVVQIDPALLAAQVRQAQAAVQTAQANLAQVKASTRAEELRLAKALLAQAVATRDGAQKAWENAQALRTNPQELEARIDAARGELAMARQRLAQAQAAVAAANESKGAADRGLDQLKGGFDVQTPQGKVHVDYPSQFIDAATAQQGLLTSQWWTAWETVNLATIGQEGTQKLLDGLLALRADPLAINAQVDAAQAQYEAAAAAVRAAQAKVDALQTGATKEQIAIAEAQVSQAQAALEALHVQLGKLTLRSPIAGLVTSRTIHVGEVAAPGATLLTIANLDSVKLTVYIPEDRIGLVKVGQKVEVSVDSFPGETFLGEVTFIASHAEFTPKNVQTKEGRVSTVFAVKVQIPNPEHKLKPGMPADAVIETG